MRLITAYKDDLLNGIGLRNVYFFSGCPHHCKGCFNPETAEPNRPEWSIWTQKDFDTMIKDASKDYISGITLSGGDPLSIWNFEEIKNLCQNFKKILPNKTIWVYTGYTWEEVHGNSNKNSILPYIDVLCEGPFIEERKSPLKPWVGSDNQRVIDVKKSLENNDIVLFD